MSAAEISELIKKLPPEERAEVNDSLNRSHVAQPDIGGQFATDADFDRAANRCLPTTTICCAVWRNEFGEDEVRVGRRSGRRQARYEGTDGENWPRLRR